LMCVAKSFFRGTSLLQLSLSLLETMLNSYW